MAIFLVFLPLGTDKTSEKELRKTFIFINMAALAVMANAWLTVRIPMAMRLMDNYIVITL